MSDGIQRRRVFLLVPHLGGSSILVDDTGNLPSFVATLKAADTTIGAAWRAVRELGAYGQIVDCFVDQTPPPDGAEEIIPAVIELTALDAAPPSTHWASLGSVHPDTGPGLAGYVAERLEEWRGLRPVPEERSAWCHHGWYERVCEWIDGVLMARGEGPAVAVTPFRQWGISAVLRVETEASRYWFKAVFAPFAAEPVVTRFLDRLRPGRVPHVIAVEPAENWMLLAEITGTQVAAAPDLAPAAISALIDLQRGFIGHTDELVEGGVTDRPLHRLPHEVVNALEHPLVQAALRVDADRAASLARRLTEAVTTVQGIGIPHTLVHGDFHPGNVMLTAGGMVLFDWSDAAVSHPLVDAAVWVSWSQDDPEAVDHLWQTFADAWCDVADPATVIAARPSLDAITGAYHFVSYARILGGLEPSRRPEALGGLTGFFELLDQSTRT
jgi:tRNA A-37 threonylcarbamoyl transferase component Bud32